MLNNKFKITLKGDEANDSLRLGDLIAQLDALKQVLNHIDKRVSGRKSPGLYYKIIALSMNSPATIEVEAVAKPETPNYGSAVIKRLGDDLSDVINGVRPQQADIELLESYKFLAKPLKGHVLQFVFSSDTNNIDIPRSLDTKVDEILGPDQIEWGAIVGSLDTIDIHNNKNTFKVYPLVGALGIKCHFSKEMLPTAISGINHFVELSGELYYKKAEKYAHFMEVKNIKILPEKSDAPSLSSLRGMAKDNFVGISSTEYIEKIRNGDW